MPIRVTVRGGDASAQMRYLQSVAGKLRDRRSGLVRATNAVAAVWEKNFRDSGGMVGGWPQLAEATIQNRVEQGMPQGPVLIKYGALKSVVTEGFMTAHGPSSWSKTDPYSPNNTKARLTLTKDMARLEAHGWKISNQYGFPNKSGRRVPARPFWFVDTAVTAAARDAITKWIADDVVKG